MASLVAKLSPTHIRLSGRFTALIAFILDQTWTDPVISWAAITSDGMLVTDSEFFGGVDDLTRNLQGVAEAADLTAGETTLLFCLAKARIENYEV